VPAPEKLTIDTPEQIPLEFTLATLGSRFLALGADTLAQAGAILALVALVAGIWLVTGPLRDLLGGGDTVGTWLFAALLLAIFTVYYGYFVFFEITWAGQTPGKRLIGLRVIHASGRPITTHEAILRNLVRVADQLPGIYAVGILTMFLTDRSQRLGDLAADTVVVHEQPVEALREPRLRAPESGPTARYGASRLSAEEIALIETFLRRREHLEGVRELRGGQIAARIRERLGLKGGEDDEEFLERVVAEYRGGYR
jgi:uncharacterized RDD family membrane protein YckC